ncbi:MAG: DUF3237 domain-containing protein [Steroidobacteraceae bacterium]
MLEHAPSLQPVCTMKLVSRVEAECIGPVPYGFRTHGFVASGVVTGPKLSGKVREGGGDWAIARADDVIDIDARVTIQTTDGSLIYVVYSGVIDLPAGSLADLQAGKLATDVRPRVQLRMTSATGPYSWVNRKQFVGFGTASLGPPTIVEYEIYHL